MFRDSPIGEVAGIASRLSLRAVQLHGAEDRDYVQALRRDLPSDCEIWTARSVGRDALDDVGGDRLLFDHGSGGSGRAFDWSLIERHPGLARSLIAGGIGAHNARAARSLGAYAIDVGSSVDLQPGRKSPEKIAGLFESLRSDCRDRLRACA